MSFLVTQPEELAAAAGKLGTIGSAMFAQNAAAAPTTTSVIPAAADEVSALQAAQFAAYGTLYQELSAQVSAMYDMFVNTLSVSADTYAAAESVNSSAAASPFSAVTGTAEAVPGAATQRALSDLANVANIGVGNWASAASNLIGMANGGLLPAEGAAAAGAGAEGMSELGSVAEPAAAGSVGGSMAAGLGAASSIGVRAPSWAGSATLVASHAPAQVAGWTAPAPPTAPMAIFPGAPGTLGTRSNAGFGAPRYGVKPLVMTAARAV
ncbi:PE family protein [Mycobacterium intermedium]|uniref:PE family protein n=1 Tax=Mycobacterium intermedium TaxID=28445 RepID=A0A1E3SBD7_MYCIE|nr:PE family protein [Mycobacterium intermedium]MCV6965846.1 PE family protein [Mycobacterium intermedium]ODQ99458.1 PE family protein [Mycobacterium intermedium]OPE50772.1 PE family protein [Mycobacterium intermedium]ORB10049.1 PE family protein [Mycobacterium intermedium]